MSLTGTFGSIRDATKIIFFRCFAPNISFIFAIDLLRYSASQRTWGKPVEKSTLDLIPTTILEAKSGWAAKKRERREILAVRLVRCPYKSAELR